MTHPSFYSSSDYLRSIPHKGVTMHMAPIKTRAPAGRALPPAPPLSPHPVEGDVPRLGERHKMLTDLWCAPGGTSQLPGLSWPLQAMDTVSWGWYTQKARLPGKDTFVAQPPSWLCLN